jgi:MarR family 2-MHQ and catechol resistance regulon transcriptional repressor
VDKSNITGLVDRMEKLELIRRNPVPGDRRRYNITLTPKGAELIDELEVAYEQRVQQIMKDFSDEECRLLVKLTTDLRRGIASLKETFS